MRMMTFVRSLGLTALVAVTGCKSLDITNPNAPDAGRALADPAAIEAVAGGAIRQWVNTYEGNNAVAPLTTQAQTYTASWNNFNMNSVRLQSVELSLRKLNSRLWFASRL